MKSELGEIGAECRLGAGHAKIRDQRKPQATADRRTMHGGDQRFAGAKQAQRLAIQLRGGGITTAGIRRGIIAAEIGAGTK